MKKYKNYIILLNLVIVIFLFNKSVFHKEETLENGKLVLLELAPVDPRSLMQGDYMRLRYAIARNIPKDSISKRGYCIVELDDKGIAQKKRFQQEVNPISTSEYAIRYNTKKWRDISIGAESYFFQEGKGENYEKAKYGGLMIDKNGKSILVGLYDKDLKKIE
jgi:uncharacterized membrane-anchored protein